MKLSLLATVVAGIVLVPTADAQQKLLDSDGRAFDTGHQKPGQAYRPVGQVLVDVDGDGDLDAVHAHVGNSAAPRFGILLNHGDGTYAAPIAVQTSQETMRVVAADLDGDGDPDLAFTLGKDGITGQAVAVFLNQGNGSFGPQKTFPTGKGPIGLAALDADGDGDIDLVTANFYFGEDDVSLLLNDGAGNFTQRADFPITSVSTYAQGYHVAAGDLDGDGDADMAVTVRGGKPAVQLLFNDGQGGFGAPVSYASTYPYIIEIPGVSLGDVDLDGNLDVLYATDLLRNNGNGTLAAPEPMPWKGFYGFMHDIALADMTGDGWPDLAATGHSANDGWILCPNDGTGRFLSQQVFSTGEMARAIDVGDVDGDGDLDTCTINMASLTMSVHLNQSGSLSLPYEVAVPSASYEHDVADIDLDGDLDVVTADSSITTLRNDGSGHFTSTSSAQLLSVLDHPALRDLNGDGYPDLLLLKNTTIGLPPYNLYTFLNNGDGTFGPASIWSLGSAGTGDVETGDFDEDGDLDVVITEWLGSPSQDGRKLYLLLNQGDGTFQMPPTLIVDYTVSRGQRLLVGDLDNDGHLDIVSGHGYLVSWMGRGDATFQAPIVSNVGPDGGTKYMTLADLDGDGFLDVAATSFSSSLQGQTLTIKLGQGDGTFRPPQTYYGMFSLQTSGVGGVAPLDVDQDGDVDLVAGCYGARDLALWVNRGDGTFEPEQRYGVDGSVTWVGVGDFDGDGRSDVSANIGTSTPIAGSLTFVFGEPIGPPVSTYCTGKVNSQGCVPQVTFAGTPSASSTSSFLAGAANVINQKNGILFYGTSGEAAFPFQGGTLCIQPKLTRTPPQNSGGNPLPDDCSGTYAFDFNPWIQGGADPGLQAGVGVFAQYWSRDPADPFGSGLSDALRFVIQP